MSNRIERGNSETSPSSTRALREHRIKVGRFLGSGLLVGAVVLGIVVDKLVTPNTATTPVLSAKDGTILRGLGSEAIMVTIQPGQSAPVLFQARGYASLSAETDSSTPSLETSLSVGNGGSGKALSDIKSLEAINTGNSQPYEMPGEVDTFGKNTSWEVQVPFGDQAIIVEKS